MAYVRRPRPRVQWKSDEQPSAPTLRTFPHVEDSTSQEELELRMPYMYKGALWHTERILWEDFRFGAGYLKHEHTYLTSHRDSSPKAPGCFLQRTVAIYLGETHVEERPWTSTGTGTTRRYVRHLFLLGSKIFMAAELRDFAPIF